MGLGSIGKVVKSVAKVAAAPFTAGASLQGGNVKDMFSNGLSNIVNGGVGIGQDQLTAAMNWQWQKKASDYAFNQNLQMWNLANAYNDPSAQMERLQKAGLNPNLVYGGGNVTGNTSGSAPTYERPNAGYTDRSIQREQLALAMKEHQQRITNQAIENDLARQRLVLAERDADRSDALAQAQIAAYKAGLGLTNAQIGNIAYNQNLPVSWFGRQIYDTVRLAHDMHNSKTSQYNFVTHKKVR